MPAIYIREQGSMLVKRGERIAVMKNSRTLLEIPLANVDNIAVIGNIQVTTQVLLMLMEQGVDISYFTYSGKYVGHAAADMSKNIFLRFAQYELYHDMDRPQNKRLPCYQFQPHRLLKYHLLYLQS